MLVNGHKIKVKCIMQRGEAMLYKDTSVTGQQLGAAISEFTDSDRTYNIRGTLKREAVEGQPSMEFEVIYEPIFMNGIIFNIVGEDIYIVSDEDGLIYKRQYIDVELV